MTRYAVGDQPTEPLVVVPARDGDEVDLELYASAEALLRNRTGLIEQLSAAIVLPAADDVDDVAHVAIVLPQLNVAGLQYVALQLLTSDGKRDTFDVDPVVVEAPSQWHTIASAHGEWKGSRDLDDVELYVLLETARIECADYGRKLEPADERWTSYRQAQLLHARNRNAAGRVDPATGDSGTDGFSLGSFPLDWTTKQLLRPSRALPVVR